MERFVYTIWHKNNLRKCMDHLIGKILFSSSGPFYGKFVCSSYGFAGTLHMLSQFIYVG